MDCSTKFGCISAVSCETSAMTHMKHSVCSGRALKSHSLSLIGVICHNFIGLFINNLFSYQLTSNIQSHSYTRFITFHCYSDANSDSLHHQNLFFMSLKLWYGYLYSFIYFSFNKVLHTLTIKSNSNLKSHSQ